MDDEDESKEKEKEKKEEENWCRNSMLSNDFG
jgi:hypothetical protein